MNNGNEFKTRTVTLKLQGQCYCKFLVPYLRICFSVDEKYNEVIVYKKKLLYFAMGIDTGKSVWFASTLQTLDDIRESESQR